MISPTIITALAVANSPSTHKASVSIDDASKKFLGSMNVSVNTQQATLQHCHDGHCHAILDLDQGKYSSVTITKNSSEESVWIKAKLKDGTNEKPFELTKSTIEELIAGGH